MVIEIFFIYLGAENLFKFRIIFSLIISLPDEKLLLSKGLHGINWLAWKVFCTFLVMDALLWVEKDFSLFSIKGSFLWTILATDQEGKMLPVYLILSYLVSCPFFHCEGDGSSIVETRSKIFVRSRILTLSWHLSFHFRSNVLFVQYSSGSHLFSLVNWNSFP